MPASYSFTSRWSVPLAAPRVWDEVERMLRPGADGTWWPGVRIEAPAASLAPGEHLLLAVRSPLGYRLRVRLTIDAVDPGRSLAASSDGDLQGTGCMTVEPAGEEASVLVFDWDVATARPWMNATAWLLRPAFERAHSHVMAAGERGLRARLEQTAG